MAKSTFFSDFKAFIAKGKIIDLAVGVVIGGAFGKITTSLVNDIIMPPLGMLIGKVKFDELKYVLQKEELNEAGAVVKEAVSINYGNFIQTIVDFLLVAFCIFLVLRVMVKGQQKLEALKKKEEEEKAAEPPKPAEPSEEVLLLREIRDSLKKQ